MNGMPNFTMLTCFDPALQRSSGRRMRRTIIMEVWLLAA